MGDIEFTEYNLFHRVGTGPSMPPTATTYTWSAKNRDTARQIGIGVDLGAAPRSTRSGVLVILRVELISFAARQCEAHGPFRSNMISP